MSKISDRLLVIKAILSNPQILRVHPSLNLFLVKYMQKFNLENVGGRLVIHSHLPAINSRAFSRFVDEHLLARTPGPTHAQVSVTNACPQNCDYCYNKSRTGKIMDKDATIKVIKSLKDMGVIWLGITGGEPLLNKDIVEIVHAIGDDCAAKLFTGGYNLTPELASDLKKAGLFYVSVSLDHWREEEHDKTTGCRGSFQTALKAIEIFNEIGGFHVGVSTVLSREMLKPHEMEQLIQFLIKSGVKEAWVSEIKPATKPLWDENWVISEEEQTGLIKLQDRINKEGKITVNYLGHFESGLHFGCNAGTKMVYIDTFGEVSPCVFLPITFGNVRDRSLQEIFQEMRQYFYPHDCCFVNSNYQLLARHYKGQMPIGREDSIAIMKEARFGKVPEFYRSYNK